MDLISEGEELLKKPIGAAAVGALGGAVLGATVTGLITRKRKKKPKRKKNETRRRKTRRRKTRRRTKHRTSRRGKLRYHKRGHRGSKAIHYTKKGQPYIILRNGRARFIKASSARARKKRKGGYY